MNDLRLCGAVPGDIIFFGKDTSDAFEKAVQDSATSTTTLYHIGIISSRYSLIHASDENGVVEVPYSQVLQSKAHTLEICSIKTTNEIKLEAAKWAETKIGATYNDIFSPNCIDSKGNEAYYCSQLITEAYKGKVEFPPHKMSFADRKTGEVLAFWIEYFRERGCEIPCGEEGSHPNQLRSTVGLTSLLERRLGGTMSRFRPNSVLRHFIDGSVVSIKGGNTLEVVEPRSGKLLSTGTAATLESVNDTVSIASEAQKKWSKYTWLQRGEVLRKAAELLKKHCEDLAYCETVDNGKPIYESRMDVMSCVDTFNYFAGVGQSLAGSHFPLDASRFAYTKREPLGVVGCIGAWNYPIQTCSWKVAPALACGNSVVYKPSPLSPWTAVYLAELLKEAGLPDGTFNVLQGDAETGSYIIENKKVNKISFTGSIPTGKKIMQGCSARNIKPLTLELGGKSSLLILEDADIESAVSGAMMANFFSQGQVCSNASKVLVHKSIVSEFTDLIVKKTKQMKVGDPLKEDTKVGAHISLQHRDKIVEYIQGAISEGAKVLCGGEKVNVDDLPDGFYLSPCILSDIRKNMKVYNEEIFGAVLLIIPFETEEEAINIANDTDMGLAAGVFTKDLSRAHTIADQLNAGNVYINTFNDVSPFVPFGGYGQSGFGRENGTAVIEHYTQIKSVFINTEKKLANPFDS